MTLDRLLAPNSRNCPNGFIMCAWRNPRFKWSLDGFLQNSNWWSGRGHRARIYHHIYERPLRGCTCPKCLIIASTWWSRMWAFWRPGDQWIWPVLFPADVINSLGPSDAIWRSWSSLVQVMVMVMGFCQFEPVFFRSMILNREFSKCL